MSRPLLIERPIGIEPISPGWKPGIIPIYYKRILERHIGNDPIPRRWQRLMLPLSPMPQLYYNNITYFLYCQPLFLETWYPVTESNCRPRRVKAVFYH